MSEAPSSARLGLGSASGDGTLRRAPRAVRAAPARPAFLSGAVLVAVAAWLTAPPTAWGEEAGLRVVTYNLAHDWPRHRVLAERVEILAQELLVQQVDVACLQEIAITRSVDTPQVLADRTGYAVRYARANGSAALIGFQDGVAVASRFPLTVTAVRWLPWPGPFESRVALRVLVTAPSGDIAVVCTHLSHRGGASRDRLRGRQAAALVELANEPLAAERQAGSAQIATLVAGDLNTTERDDAYGTVVAAGYRDAALVARSAFSTSGVDDIDSIGEPHRRIDFIFVGAPVKTQASASSEVLGVDPFLAGRRRIGGVMRWVSDHIGVLVTLRLP